MPIRPKSDSTTLIWKSLIQEHDSDAIKFSMKDIWYMESMMETQLVNFI